MDFRYENTVCYQNKSTGPMHTLMYPNVQLPFALNGKAVGLVPEEF